MSFADNAQLYLFNKVIFRKAAITNCKQFVNKTKREEKSPLFAQSGDEKTGFYKNRKYIFIKEKGEETEKNGCL